MCKTFLILLVTFCSSMFLTQSTYLEDEINLINDVIEKRSLFALCDPRRDTNITIEFIFYPLFIIGLDERQQVLTSSGWVDFAWTDPRLLWNASDYGGIEKVYVKQHKIWIPDLVVENSVTDFSILGSDNDFVLVYSDGTVEWSPGNVYRTICEVDVGNFPFDSQECFLNISTWMYFADEINLVPSEDPIVMTFFKTNSEWHVLNLSISKNKYEYENIESFQDAISFNFKLKRRSSFYVLKIIIPTVVLSVLNSFVFIVAPESGEKVSMSVTTMLSLTVFLSYIGEVTPNNSESIPVIALFVVLHLALGALSIIANIIIMDLHYKYRKDENGDKNKNINDYPNINNNEVIVEEEMDQTEFTDSNPKVMKVKVRKAVKVMRFVDKFFFGFFLLLSLAVTAGCVLSMLY